MRNKRQLRKDIQAEDATMYPFILIIALVLILGFTVSGLSKYAVSGEMQQPNYPGYSNPFGLANYTTIEADSDDPRFVTYEGEEGYLISDDDVLDRVPYPTDNDPFIFIDDDGDYKYVHIIRNNIDYNPESTDMWEKYRDFVAIRRHTGAFDWDTQWNNAVVPFTTIIDNWFNVSDVSVSDFQLSGSQDSIFVNSTTGPGLANLTTDLWNNDFNLFYGWSLFRLSEADFWGAVSMVYYGEIPGINDTVAWMFHAFTLGTTIFVVFAMSLRIWDAVVPL